LKVVRNRRSTEKIGGFKERILKNKKIHGISAKIGDTVTIKAGRSKQITGAKIIFPLIYIYILYYCEGES
tara:strand:- start:138 stop:347 length:210 start_codon:yes stop_codon:yes gene_type:complete